MQGAYATESYPYTLRMGNFFRRWIGARKLAKGQCASCSRILPDTGAAFSYNTCSQECADERFESHII